MTSVKVTRGGRCARCGRATDRDHVVRSLSPQSNCPAEKIQLDTEKQVGALGYTRATGCGREFTCAWRNVGSYSEYMDCDETEAFKGPCDSRGFPDRLALETDCPRESIAITNEARLSRAGERVFRLAACGSNYICTTAPGRTDFKAATGPATNVASALTQTPASADPE